MKSLAHSLVAWTLSGALLSVAWAGGCRGGAPQGPAASSEPRADGASDLTVSDRPALPAVEAPAIGADAGVDLPGVKNYLRYTEHIHSGSEPHGAEGFATLAALGVRTVLSVDGLAPDADAARRFGLRYVHVPIGYHGITEEQAVKITRTVKELPGPVFIHCHHGKHRGPAAAALALVQCAGFEVAQAHDAMRRAQTSPKYAGLWASVAQTPRFDAATLAAHAFDFPARAALAPLPDEMSRIGRMFEALQQGSKRGFQPDPAHPDVALAHEALMLREAYAELLRAGWINKREPAFIEYLHEGERTAGQLQAALAALDPADEQRRFDAEDAFELAGRVCGNCHNDYRNNAPPATE